jgi:hypothetical protein
MTRPETTGAAAMPMLKAAMFTAPPSEIVGDGGQHPGEHELRGAPSEDAQPEDIDDERHDPAVP